MLSENDIKEEFSHAYLHIIATKKGYSMERVVKDRDSIDVSIRTKAKLAEDSIIHSPQLDIQLKATSQKMGRDQIHFDLSIKNYNDLRSITMVPRILILFALPENDNEYVSCTEEQLVLKGTAFWKNLHGLPAIENESSKTIIIPRKNRFEMSSLEKMMVLLSKGERIPYEF